eukprot:m.150546 g.150546  ORF g.150546 m.150546 type:complete len:51 (-) comp30731_c0_seq2:159-311(-)
MSSRLITPDSKHQPPHSEQQALTTNRFSRTKTTNSCMPITGMNTTNNLCV